MIRKNKKSKRRLPTVEEFLQYQPMRADIEWEKNEDGLITLLIPKFQSKIGKSFCKTLRREELIPTSLDELGSRVWENCDGKKSVKQILNNIKKQFPKEENIDQRLFLFLQQLQRLQYIAL